MPLVDCNMPYDVGCDQVGAWLFTASDEGVVLRAKPWDSKEFLVPEEKVIYRNM